MLLDAGFERVKERSRRRIGQDRIFIHNLDTPYWVRVEGRLVRYSERPSMDQQVVTMDQFTATMASIQEALASLRQEISGQQSRPPTVQDETSYDSHPHPPPPPVPSVPQASPHILHGHSEIVPPAIDYYQKVLFCRPNNNGFKHL